MRYISVIALLAFAGGAHSQTVPLEIKGGNVRTVKVDRMILVKDDLLVVDFVPFDVTAPPGALYFWTIPPGVQGIDKGEIFEVTAAPKGLMTFTVKAITADVDKDGKFKGLITTIGRISVAHQSGDAPPIVPPVIPPVVPPVVPPVPPVPLDQFEINVAAAYAQDTDAKKDEFRKQLASLYRQGIPYARDAKVQTSGALYAQLVKAESILDKSGALPLNCLPNTKAVIRTELNRVLERNPLAPFTEDARKTAAATLERVAVALEKLK